MYAPFCVYMCGFCEAHTIVIFQFRDIIKIDKREIELLLYNQNINGYQFQGPMYLCEKHISSAEL